MSNLGALTRQRPETVADHHLEPQFDPRVQTM
jgi:hypothetical protein